MLTDKSSEIFQGKKKRAILLELNPKAIAPPYQKLFPQRIKKLQESTFSRKARTIKLLQSLELIEYGKSQATQSLPARQEQSNKHKISSYLIYKKQQHALRTNHNFKLLHLKSKYFQSKIAAKRVAQSSFHSQSDSQKAEMKISNSKLNLIVMDLNETEDNFCKSRAKSRDVYIKTSEGKRHKMNTADYEKKLKTKLNSPNRETKQQFQRFNEYSQSTFVTNFEQTRQPPPHQTCNIMRRKFNIKAKATSLANFKLERSIEFRPWTSNKSQRGQQ